MGVNSQRYSDSADGSFGKEFLLSGEQTGQHSAQYRPCSRRGMWIGAAGRAQWSHGATIRVVTMQGDILLTRPIAPV